MPPAHELSLIEEEGWNGFDKALRLLLSGEDFNQHFATVWMDLIRSDFDHVPSESTRLDRSSFPYNRWLNDPEYGEPIGSDVANQMFTRERQSMYHEPNALVNYILREGRPFGEVLTANYTLVNGYLARIYGLFPTLKDEFTNTLNPLESVVGRIPDFPHSGILTTPTFMILTSGYNGDRNRTRAATVLRQFDNQLNLKSSAATMNMTSLAHNPTQNDAQCAGCHLSIDTTAGIFRNWTSGGGYIEDRPWFEEMPRPGMGEEVVPPYRRSESVRWLAEKIVEGEQFPQAIARQVYRILLERPPLTEPLGGEPYADSYAKIYSAQQSFLQRAASVFKEHEQDLRILIKAVVKSPWYRANGYSDPSPPPVGARRYELSQMGRSGLVDPITLNIKLYETTGYRWYSGRLWQLGPRATPFYYMGGWQSYMGGERTKVPSTLALNTQRYMALVSSCEMIPYEFWLMNHHSDQVRRLLPFIDDDTSLFDEEGFIDPDVEARVRDNLSYLMYWLWDQRVAEDDIELEELFDYFVATTQAGQERIDSGEEFWWLSWSCRGDYDHEMQQTIPNDQVVATDRNYTVRAWQAMLYVFLADSLFVLEGGE